MSSAKNERLLNLLICLTSTRQFLSADRIRRAVVTYNQDDSPKGRQAFERMFERDKEELRELGVVIETGSHPFGDGSLGYRIAGRDSFLPDLALTPAESTVLAIATDWWRSAQFASETQGAVRKLKAGGVKVDETVNGWDPQLRGSDPAFDTLLLAATAQQEVEFDYRARTSDPPVSRRRLQPWGLVSWKARWYLVGHDLNRDDTRVFRLSRILSDVVITSDPGAFEREDRDLRAIVGDAGFAQPLRAVIRLHDTAAPGLRRMTAGVEQPEHTGDIAIRARDAAALASIVAPYGATVEVLEPPEARAATIARLRQLAVLGSEGDR
ncbi:MAG: helix-turn-helix transcriptional regulator [Cumulibacter sp.]